MYRQRSTGAWLQRIDGGDQDAEAMRLHAAASFGVAEADVEAVVSDMLTAAREAAALQMGTGTYRAAPVIPAPPSKRAITRSEELATAIKAASTLDAVKAAIAKWATP